MAQAMTFEKAITRLEQIVGILEGGQCTLDDVRSFARWGCATAALCIQRRGAIPAMPTLEELSGAGE